MSYKVKNGKLVRTDFTVHKPNSGQLAEMTAELRAEGDPDVTPERLEAMLDFMRDCSEAGYSYEEAHDMAMKAMGETAVEFAARKTGSSVEEVEASLKKMEGLGLCHMDQTGKVRINTDFLEPAIKA